MKKQIFLKIEYLMDSFDEFYGCYKDFHEGYASVWSSRGYFYIDEEGKKVSDRYYSTADDFSEGLALVRTSRGLSYINTDFQTEIEFSNTSSEQYVGGSQFKNDRAIVIKKGRGKYGSTVINKKGEELVPFGTYYFLKYSEGYYLVQNKNGDYGYLDEDFNIVIPIIYNEAQAFQNGIAKVTKGKKTYYINKKGEQIDIDSFDETKKTNVSTKWRKAIYDNSSIGRQTGFVTDNFEHLKIRETIIIKPGDYIPKNAENMEIKSYICVFNLDGEDVVVEKDNLAEFKKEVNRIQNIINEMGYDELTTIEERVLDSHKIF